MKNNRASEKSHELVSVLICTLVVAAVIISGCSAKLSLASAEIMFHAPPERTAAPSKVKKATKPAEEPTSAAPKPELPADITETPKDILDIIKKYTELYADDKRDADIRATTYGKTGATHIFENVKVKNTTDTKPLCTL